LEVFYGKQTPLWPTDPYEFLIWWHCGYPASDARCAKGWDSLSRLIGVATDKILGASLAELGDALMPGGMAPELRAFRMKTIAAKVRDEFGDDLARALRQSPAQARKILKTFSNIGDGGADRIVLFAGLAPVAAIPSNCPHVLVRMLFGKERPNYNLNYRNAQDMIAAEVPEKFEARSRAYLLLKRHGQEICKTKPRCEKCPMSADCAYFADQRRKTRSVG